MEFDGILVCGIDVFTSCHVRARLAEPESNFDEIAYWLEFSVARAAQTQQRNTIRKTLLGLHIVDVRLILYVVLVDSCTDVLLVIEIIQKIVQVSELVLAPQLKE